MEATSAATATMTISVKETSSDEQKSAAYTALSTGKRHLLVSEVSLAVSSLALACKLLSSVFGETAPECGEAYYYYGKSLLELSRLESRVLGNALEGVDMDSEETKDTSQVEDTEKMTAEEKTDVEEKVAEALDENFEAHDKLAKIHSVEDLDLESAEDSQDSAMEEESPVKKVQGTADEKPEAEAGEKPMEEDKEAPMEVVKDAMEEDAAKKEGEDEEPSNLQLAWEMLELAKVVYTKDAEACTDAELKKELEQKICEAYLGLGEISLENENYGQAVEDFTTCLGKRKANLPADSRSIAETHYQLGVALAYDSKYPEAETSLNSAIKVLQARIANLKKIESSDHIAREVTDLEALVTEVQEKIVDHKEMQKETQTVKCVEEAIFSGSGDGKAISSIEIKRKDLSEAKPVGTPTTPSA